MVPLSDQRPAHQGRDGLNRIGRSTRLAAAGAALLVAGLSSACSREVALDDWLRRADSVCAQAQASADERPPVSTQLPGDAFRRLAQLSRDEVAKLRDLPSPEQRRSSVAEWFVVLDRRIEALDNYAKAIDEAPTAGARPDQSRLEDVTTDAYTQAVALGLERCGAGVDAPGATTTTTELPTGGPAPTLEPPGPAPDEGFETEDSPG